MAREPFFITEQDTEALLVQETRDLPWPDGSLRPVTAFSLLWEAFDYLVYTDRFTAARLIELCLENSQQTDLSFEDSFTNGVAYLADRELKKDRRRKHSGS